MKSKFKLGFLEGWRDVPNAWPGSRYVVQIANLALFAGGTDLSDPDAEIPTKHMVFECKRVDDDKTAIFELLEVR